MEKTIQIVTLVVVIVSIIVSVFLALYSIEESSQSSQEIIDTFKKGNAELLEETKKSNKNDAASIEKSFFDFQPELKYRIFSTYADDQGIYSIRADITNKGTEQTFVKNRWTITGEICNPDTTSRDFDYDYSVRENLILNKEEMKKIKFEIPSDFFEKFPDKTAFILRLELEMNPYLPSSGPIETREFDEMAFIQYDYDEERNSWMPKNQIARGIDCTNIPSDSGQVFLNTTSWDFGEYGQWWKFPEE